MSGACEIDRVEFTSSNGDEGFAVVRGRRLKILGIPVENPNSDQTPLKLAAKCRDAKVGPLTPRRRARRPLYVRHTAAALYRPARPSQVPYTFPFSEFLATQKKQKQQEAAAGGGGLSLPSLPSLPSLSLPKLPF